MSNIKTRKLKHIDICLNYPVNYQRRSTGFEYFDLPYQALPETSLDSVELTTHFLGKHLRAPLLIGAMTGGAALAASINKNLAIAAQELGIGLMLGSQRIMLEQSQALASFQIRSYAPDILLIGNLGVAQLNKGYSSAHIRQAIELVAADALALHTNPLQEALQENGDSDFCNIISKLPDIVRKVPYPIILKEVGHGLSEQLAQKVAPAGLAALDIAGAGGTSWARVEELARYGEIRHPELVEWGIPTADALQSIHRALPQMPLIASGGIRSGLDIAKALVLGAKVCAIAQPLLKPATESAEAVIRILEPILHELRIAMHCSGVQSVEGLRGLSLRTVRHKLVRN